MIDEALRENWGQYPDTNKRHVQRKTDGEWVHVEMKELVDGDIFRLWENDNQIVVWRGSSEFIVEGAPREIINENDVATWGVDIRRA